MYEKARERLSLKERLAWIVGVMIGVIIAFLKLTGNFRFGWEWVILGPLGFLMLVGFASLVVWVGRAFLELTDAISPNVEEKVQDRLRFWIKGKSDPDRIKLTDEEIRREERTIRKELIERRQSENKMSLKGFVLITAVLGILFLLGNSWFRYSALIAFWLILALGGVIGLIEVLSSHDGGSKFHYKRGLVYLFNKEHNQAIDAFTEAIRLDTKCAAALYDRGNAWTAKNEYDKAIADFSEALRLEPTSDAAYCNRGNAWWFKHQSERALADYLEAIRLDPNQAVYYRNCALVLSTCPEASLRDGKRAILLATKACELTNWAGAWEMAALAAAYAENGEFDEAEHCQIRSFDVPNSSDGDRAEFRKRLELYKRKLPYRETVVIQRLLEVEDAARRAAAYSERETSARRAVQEPVSTEQEDGQEAKNLRSWIQSGMPREWALEHIDGWDQFGFVVLCNRVKFTQFWPMRIGAMAACLERLRSELLAERVRQEEEVRRRKVEVSYPAIESPEASQPIDTSPAPSAKHLTNVIIKIVRSCREQHALRTEEFRKLVIQTFTEKFKVQPTFQQIEEIESAVMERLNASRCDGWILPTQRMWTRDSSNGVDWLENWDLNVLGRRDNSIRAREGD